MFYSDGQPRMAIREFIPYLEGYPNFSEKKESRNPWDTKVWLIAGRNWDWHIEKIQKNVRSSLSNDSHENMSKLLVKTIYPTNGDTISLCLYVF